MASMSRSRGDRELRAPGKLYADYYSARADAGLIFTEASAVSLESDSYGKNGNIYSQEQVKRWKVVTDAVHSKGGKIFIHLYHGGRTVHPNISGGIIPIGPSAIAHNVTAVTPAGVVPRIATEEDLKKSLVQFREAAENSKAAGFDGIQINVGHGYLQDSFLRQSCNLRTDKYGGSWENRARLTYETIEEVLKVYKPERVGLRITPLNNFHDMSDPDPIGLFKYLLKELSKQKLGFIEVSEGFSFNPVENQKMKEDYYKDKNYKTLSEILRPHFTSGIWIAGFGFTQDSGNQLIQQGHADMISYGLPFLANDDLVQKFAKGVRPNDVREIKDQELVGKLVYGSDALGYTDMTPYSIQ